MRIETYEHETWLYGFDDYIELTTQHEEGLRTKLYGYLMCDEITNPFLNFNVCTVEDWEWMSYFILHINGHMVTYFLWN